MYGRVLLARLGSKLRASSAQVSSSERSNNKENMLAATALIFLIGWRFFSIRAFLAVVTCSLTSKMSGIMESVSSMEEAIFHPSMKGSLSSTLPSDRARSSGAVESARSMPLSMMARNLRQAVKEGNKALVARYSVKPIKSVMTAKKRSSLP